MNTLNKNGNILISIEGNIGSGKSTLLKELQNIYSNEPNIIFLKEPVDEWQEIKDNSGMSILEKFYENKVKYSFSFQMMAFISRLAILKKAMNENINSIIITERSLYTDKYVFAQMLYDTQNIEDVNYQIYLKWFEEFTKDFPVNYFIYIKAKPTICHERIMIRSRKGEDVISLEYLTNCHDYHEVFINSASASVVHILDGNKNIYDEKNILTNWLFIIDSIIENETLQKSIYLHRKSKICPF